MPSWPFSKTKEVKCADGPRFMLKDPNEAFKITFPTWDVRFNALVKLYTGPESSGEAHIKKKTESIVQDLTENYAKLQLHYQMAYLGWWGNPCSKEAEKAYNEARQEICDRELTFSDIEKDSEKLKESVRADQKKRVFLGSEKPEKIAAYLTALDRIQAKVSKLKIET